VVAGAGSDQRVLDDRLNVWLIWAIVKRRAYRHVLQLALGSYLSYSVILYWLAGHLSGYEGMRSRTAYAFILF
jgi:hypothetical protein